MVEHACGKARKQYFVLLITNVLRFNRKHKLFNQQAILQRSLRELVFSSIWKRTLIRYQICQGWLYLLCCVYFNLSFNMEYFYLRTISADFFFSNCFGLVWSYTTKVATSLHLITSAQFLWLYTSIHFLHHCLMWSCTQLLHRSWSCVLLCLPAKLHSRRRSVGAGVWNHWH